MTVDTLHGDYIAAVSNLADASLYDLSNLEEWLVTHAAIGNLLARMIKIEAQKVVPIR